MREIEQKNKIYEVEREKNFQVVVSDRTLLWQQKLRILKDLTPPPEGWTFAKKGHFQF